MSQATLHNHLQAVAQAGYQQALFCTQQGMLKMRSEAFHLWARATEAFEQHAWEPIFVDETHAGAIVASAYDLQHRKENLKVDL